MALFDTTKQQSLYPGLNPTQGVVDRSGLIDDSAVSTVAGLTGMGLDYAIAEDKADVLNTAKTAAQELTDEYLSRSPSEQSYLLSQRDELQSNLPSVSDTKKQNIMNRLHDVNERLARASSQGVMSAIEYERRLASIAQDLSNQNPVYSQEISSEMNALRGRLGVNDVISQDQQLLAQQTKAMNKQYETMIETVSPFVLDPYALSPDELQLEFYKVKQTQIHANRITNMLENKDLLDKMDSQTKMAQFEAMDPAEIRKTTADSLTSGLRAIARDNSITYQERVERAQDLIRNAKNDHFALTNGLPLDDPRVKHFMENTKGLFETLEKQVETDLSLEGIEKYTSKKKSILQNGIDINYMELNGTYAEHEERLSSMVSNYARLKQVGILDVNMENHLINLVQKVSSGLNNPKFYQANELAIFEDKGFNKLVASEVNKITGEEGDATTNLVKNYLDTINNLDSNTESSKKVTRTHNMLKSFGNLAPEAFNNAMNNDELKQAFEENLNGYADFVILDLARETAGNPEFSLNMDSTTGRWEPVNSQAAQRLNVYIKAASRLLGKPVKDISKDIFEQEISVKYNQLLEGFANATKNNQ